jgi:hypothetical protein
MMYSSIDASAGQAIIETGVSAKAVAFASSFHTTHIHVKWTSATVQSSDRSLRLTGHDISTNQTWTMDIVGCMACGFDGTGPQSAAEIISILMPSAGNKRQILRKIAKPSAKATDWQNSRYTVTIRQ